MDELDWDGDLEVVVIEQSDDGAFVTGRSWRWRVTQAVPLTPEDAREVRALWRGLPDHQMARCHMPRYGLRVTRDAQVVSSASLCFRCNNIYFERGGRFSTIGFDAESPPALALVALLRAAVGARPAEDSDG